jgi:tetratricopeptide (TPR) repeat protein
MSKTHENAGRLALMQGNKAYAEGNFPVAEGLFKDAVAEYSQSGNSAVVTENLGKTYINLSASLVAQSKLDEAIQALTEADGKGFRSTEFNKNFAVAHYNLGLHQK